MDPKDVQESIHYKMMPKAQQISDSLFGTLNTHQIFLIRQSWNHIIFLEEQLEQLEKRIQELLIAYKEQVDLLLTIPGLKENSVANIIAEIGIEMSQFRSAQHLASWAGLAPRGGKKKALITIAHKTLKIIYHILSGKQPFIEYAKLLA